MSSKLAQRRKRILRQLALLESQLAVQRAKLREVEQVMLDAGERLRPEDHRAFLRALDDVHSGRRMPDLPYRIGEP